MKKALALLVLALTAAPAAMANGARETPIVKVIREWAPAVVNISTEQIVLLRKDSFWSRYNGYFRGIFDNLETQPYGTTTLNSLGSGVVISEEGLIVTNAHVVQMATHIYVTLEDGTKIEARLVGMNAHDDMALVLIKAPKPLKAVRVARDVMIGETVISIGNSLGLQNSVSAGIVSGVGRNLEQQGAAFHDLIQTDASINPGSSGGALFNTDGELVGINLALIMGAQSVAFAIPAAKIEPVLKEYHALKAAEKKT